MSETEPGLADNEVTIPVSASDYCLEPTAESEIVAWLNAGRYSLVRPLEQGGMGEVYLVYDRDLERRVALKVIRQEYAQRPDFQERFHKEARALSRLEHPNIVPIHDLGATPAGHLYFTMRFIEGETLDKIIRRLTDGNEETHRRWPFVSRLHVVQQICDAVQFAHDAGVLHRDLKPGNIMVGPHGEVTVMDWGLARAHSARADAEATPIEGTPGYLAPETLRGQPADPLGDVFSIGTLLYALLALEAAFPGGDGLDNLMAGREPTAPEGFVKPIQGRVPREISLIAMRAMALDRGARYPSLTAVRDDITEYLNGQSKVVCVHTGLKHVIYDFARLVDNHGNLVIVGLTTLVTAPPIVLLVWWLQHR